MHDGTKAPDEGPVSFREKTSPAAGLRVALLLGIGGGVGLALGILLTIGVFAALTVLTTPTLPATGNSVQVFNELNELRRQVNQLNEDRKLKDQEKEESLRQALSAVGSAARVPGSEMPGVELPVKKPGEAAKVSPVAKPGDPYADIDAEIERLEQTQKVLNTILDLFTPKNKEPGKDR